MPYPCHLVRRRRDARRCLLQLCEAVGCGVQFLLGLVHLSLEGGLCFGVPRPWPLPCGRTRLRRCHRRAAVGAWRRTVCPLGREILRELPGTALGTFSALALGAEVDVCLAQCFLYSSDLAVALGQFGLETSRVGFVDEDQLLLLRFQFVDALAVGTQFAFHLDPLAQQLVLPAARRCWQALAECVLAVVAAIRRSLGTPILNEAHGMGSAGSARSRNRARAPGLRTEATASKSRRPGSSVPAIPEASMPSTSSERSLSLTRDRFGEPRPFRSAKLGSSACAESPRKLVWLLRIESNLGSVCSASKVLNHVAWRRSSTCSASSSCAARRDSAGRAGEIREVA